MAFDEHRHWPDNLWPADDRDAVVIAAGDIADRNGRMRETASLVAQDPSAVVLALGDNAYDSGTADELRQLYDPTWGPFNGRVWTCPGNHDYRSALNRPFPHYAYFKERAGPDSLGYYSLDVGAWHLVCLNSEIARDDRSQQIAWLRADLQRHRGKPLLAFFHRPLFSSGSHGHDRSQIYFWHALYQHNAEIVLNGHDHNYERFDPQDPEGHFVAQGIREFVVGTGGKSLRSTRRAEKHSVVRGSGVQGVLELTLGKVSYSWRFRGIDGTIGDQSAAPVAIHWHSD